MFLAREAHETRVEIETTHREPVGGQKAGVLTGAACHVEHRLASRIDLPQQTRYPHSFGVVVLESRVNLVVELRRGVEHVRTTSRARSCPSRLLSPAAPAPVLPRREVIAAR